MAGKKNDAVEIDALLTPTLGDMSKVEKELGAALSKAAKPLVDTVNDAKVGLNQKSLVKAQRQLDTIAQSFGDSFGAAISKVMDGDNKHLRSAKGLKQLAKQDSGVAQLVKVLGGYNEAAGILNRPDAQRRLQSVSKAFQSLQDTAFQISKLPPIGDDVQKLLTRMYRSNSVDSFRKLSEVQQRQVKDALAIIDLQDSAFRSLRQGLGRAGLGSMASQLGAAMTGRKEVAARLRSVASPQAVSAAARRDEKRQATRVITQERLDRAAARSRAVSEEKDRVLRRTEGIQGLRERQDITAVRAGLNRDYNLGLRQASINAIGPGGKNSKAYRDSIKAVDALRAQRDELDQLVKTQQALARQQQLGQKTDVEGWKARGMRDKKWRLLNEKADQDAWKARGRLLSARNAAEQRADVEAWKERGRLLSARNAAEQRADVEDWKARGTRDKKRRLLNEKADVAANSQRVADARGGASYAEAQRLIQSAGGIGKMTDKLDMATVRSGLNTQLNQLVKDREVARAYGQNTATIQANIDALRSQRQALSDRTAQLAAEAKALSAANKGSQRNTQLARNTLQARDILRGADGNFEDLSKAQIRTLRPYMQDRFQSRSRYAESIGSQYGTDSPEFSRAAASAQQYAAALGELDNRARALKPSMTDLGHIVHGFIRYALGYGALYQLLGGVTALTRGLVDLDEQLYNIQAITLSTDSQMRTIDGAIKQVGLTTKFTLNEIAQGAQILAQAGSAPEVIPEQLKATADFAAATNTSISSAADLLTSFQNVYTDIGSGKTADLLTKTLNLSKLQGDDLRTIVSYTAQTAEGYNIGPEQLLGAVATLRNVGIKPSTVATGLRQAMLEVFNPDAKLTKALKQRYAQLDEEMSEQAIQARYNAFTFTDNPLLSAVAELRRIGFGGEASNQFARAFDVRALTPLLALVNNFDLFSQLSTQVGVGRSAAEASEIQLESLRATLENLGAATVVFADSIGGDMVRGLQSATQGVTDLILKLTELDQQMKLETGSGLGSVIGAGVGGGALGALLAGRGALNRIGGFAAGAYAGGSAASAGPDSGAMDYAIPAIAGLLTVAPALADFLGGARSRAAEIRTLAAKAKSLKGGDIGTSLGPALGAGATLVDLATSFGRAKLPDGLKGAGIAGIARVGSGLLLRAIPIVGILWTAYEILSLITGRGADKLQAEADKARTQAIAAGAQYRSLDAKYQSQQSAISEYRIDDLGNTSASGTAAGAVALQSQAQNLNLAASRVLGQNITSLGEAASLVHDYADRDADQRAQDLQQLRAITGQNLTDKDVYDLSSHLRELESGVNGYRADLVAALNRSTDDLRAAIAAGDQEAIAEAGTMQRVLDTLPELREFLYGRIELDADKVTELYVEFNKRMASELEKGSVTASQVLTKRVEAAARDIDAVAVALRDSPQVTDAIQQIIGALELTEKDVVGALDALAEKVREDAAKLGQRAADLEARANQEREAGNRINRSNGRLASEGFGYMRLENANRLDQEAAAFRSRESTARKAEETATKGARLASERDTVAKTTAEARAAETISRVADAVTNGKFTKEFMANLTAGQVALVQQVMDPKNRQDLVDSGQTAPLQMRTGDYRPSSVVEQLNNILRANQQARTVAAETSKQKQREAANSAYLSDPATMVEIARLENQRKASERRNDLGGAQSATQRIFDLQYGEQQKAVQRAKLAMDEAKDGDKKDATGAIERYNSELAKLESMRGDMADKIDQYQKKIQDIDLRNRAAAVKREQDLVKGQFTEAVDRGNLEGAIEASQAYEDVQRRLREVMEEELKAKGLSAEQIKTEVEDRKDLTTALIDQEGAQKRLTSAIIARSDFEARLAGTGPTTGNKTTDAFIEASGVGFTSAQYDSAYARDLELYQRQVSSLQASFERQRQQLTGEDARAAEQSYIQKLDEVQAKIGETAAKMQQLRNNFSDELMEGLNPTAMLVQLQRSQNAMQNFGENLRTHLVSGVDELGQAFANVARRTEEWDDALKSVVHNLANNIFDTGAKMGVNWLFQQGLGAIAGTPASPGSGGAGMPGAGGGEEQSGGFLSGFLGAFGGMGGGMTSTGTMTVNAGTVMVNGGVMPGTGDILPSVTGGDTADKISGAVSSLGDKLENGFSSFLSGIGNVFSGLFGGGGGGSNNPTWGKFMLNAGMSYFGAGAASGAASGGYTGAYGFKDGGQPSRVIRGKRSLKRDNLMATAEVAGRVEPIKVEDGEGILSRKAMSLIGGEKGLAQLNNSQTKGFSVGGTMSPSYNPGQPTTAGSANIAAAMSSQKPGESSTEVNIANVYSEEQFASFVASRGGRNLIINELKKAGAL